MGQSFAEGVVVFTQGDDLPVGKQLAQHLGRIEIFDR
jgi:hypothetical protein